MRRRVRAFRRLERTMQAARRELFAWFSGPRRREEALAYAEVNDLEEIIDAERRAAIIRERMRRQGLLR